MNNENKYFEEIQEKTKEIIKSDDEKLNTFELKEGMKFKRLGDNEVYIVSTIDGNAVWNTEGSWDCMEIINWEETRKLNNIKQQQKQSKYIIWNPKGSNPEKIHQTLKSAEKEAERLVLSQPNEDFYVLEVVKKVRGSVSIVWE